MQDLVTRPYDELSCAKPLVGTTRSPAVEVVGYNEFPGRVHLKTRTERQSCRAAGCITAVGKDGTTAAPPMSLDEGMCGSEVAQEVNTETAGGLPKGTVLYQSWVERTITTPISLERRQ